MKKTKTSKPSDVSAGKLLQLIIPTFKRYRSRLLAGFLALLLVDFIQLIIPRIIKFSVDGLAQNTITQNSLLKLAGLIVVLAMTVAGLRFCWRFLIIGFSRLLEQGIRNRVFSHILNMDAPFFEKHTTGDLMARSSNDLGAIQMACGMGLVAAVDAFVMSSASLAFMFHIHIKLTLLAILPMPFLAICTRILSAKLHKRFHTVQDQFSQLTEFARSTLVAIRLIKAYTTENFQTDRFNTLGKHYVKSNLKVAFIQGLMFPIATLVGNLGMLMVLWFGGRLVIEGSITIGDFVAFITYLYMLVWPMMAIGWVANLVQRGLTSLGRIHELVTSKPVLPAIESAPIPHHPNPTYSLNDLTFTYKDEDKPTISNISLELTTGIHGIVGRTGSGKSTLCKILTRLYHVDNGRLYFNGLDVNTLPVSFVREHISYVGQEPILFSDTIGANIALGMPDSSQKEVESAAKDAAIHRDIEALADGYNTVIGERGVKLSGGQRQRLALARALICDRPILIIDDGLSAVDVATEHEVFQGLQKRFKDKAVVIVSNRVKLLSMCDRIMVLESGKISVSGNHETLLAQSSLYRTMYDKQMQHPTLQESQS